MSSERKVAVITGASQGMGAALVEAYRDRDYGVVATARSIRPTNDDQILAVPGDITGRNVNQAVFVGFSHISWVTFWVSIGPFRSSPDHPPLLRAVLSEI
jgi:nucleoside-diphosphate-sugar epimerase